MEGLPQRTDRLALPRKRGQCGASQHGPQATAQISQGITEPFDDSPKTDLGDHALFCPDASGVSRPDARGSPGMRCPIGTSEKIRCSVCPVGLHEFFSSIVGSEIQNCGISKKYSSRENPAGG